MNESNLPRHIIDKLERRWAKRLASEATIWRSDKAMHAAPTEIVDRAGRSIPVTVRRAFFRRAGRPTSERIA